LFGTYRHVYQGEQEAQNVLAHHCCHQPVTHFLIWVRDGRFLCQAPDIL
jgi:hypothetical protein